MSGKTVPPASHSRQFDVDDLLVPSGPACDPAGMPALLDVKTAKAVMGLLLRREAAVPGYDVRHHTAPGRVISAFHPWVNAKAGLGIVTISQTGGPTLHVVAISDFTKGTYEAGCHVLVFTEDRQGTSIELRDVQRGGSHAHFVWTYKPTKRDGRNPERVERFVAEQGARTVRLPLPMKADEAIAFIDAVFATVEAREQADALMARPDPPIGPYLEGDKKVRMHTYRERNRALVRAAKARWRSKHGRLFCEVCSFDFATRYGPRGEDFIEAHHTIPVMTLEDGSSTRVEDLAMLCSNCHRMIHAGSELLTMEQLRAVMTALT